MGFSLLIAAIRLGSNARDALFLDRVGRDNLPYIFGVTALLLLGLAGLRERVSRRLTMHSLSVFGPILFALGLGVLALLSHAVGTPSAANLPLIESSFGPASAVHGSAYVFVDVLAFILIVAFWIFASHHIDARTGKRVFPVVVAGGTMSALLAGLVPPLFEGAGIPP